MNVIRIRWLIVAAVLAVLRVSPVVAEIIEQQPLSPLGNVPDFVGAGHALVLTDDGGRAEVFTEAKVIASWERYVNITKYDAAGVIEWSANLIDYDGAAVRAKQGSVADRDLYVIWNHDGWGPGVVRLDISTGNVVWETHPWMPSYAYGYGSSFFDIGGRWSDFVFHRSPLGDVVVIFGMEGDIANNLAGVYYTPSITIIERATGKVLSQEIYGTLSPNAFPGAANLLALWPVRALPYGPTGGYLVTFNAIEAISQSPGYRFVGFFEFHVDPVTLQFNNPYSTYLTLIHDNFATYPPVVTDAIALGPTQYALTGYVENGPLGAKDVFVIQRDIPPYANNVPAFGGGNAVTNVYGTALDEVASGIARDSNGEFLLTMSHGAQVPADVWVEDGGVDSPGILKLDPGYGIEWARLYTPYQEGTMRAVETDGTNFRVLGDGTPSNGTRVGLSALVAPSNPGDPRCALADVSFSELQARWNHPKFKQPSPITQWIGPDIWTFPWSQTTVAQNQYCLSCTVQANFVYQPQSPVPGQDTFLDLSSGSIGAYSWSANYSGNVLSSSVSGSWTVTPPAAFTSATLTVADANEPLCVDTYEVP